MEFYQPTVLNPKPLPKAFITPDGYAGVNFGSKLMIIYEGQQLKVCNTYKSAMNFIKTHRTTSKKGTVFIK